MTSDLTPADGSASNIEARFPENRPPAEGNRRVRFSVITGVAVLGAVALTGGGVAAGVALASSAQSAEVQQGSSGSYTQRPSDGEGAQAPWHQEDRGSRSADEPPAPAWGAAEAEALIDAVAAALSSSGGAAVGIESGTPGEWVVTLVNDAGKESDVRVMADRTAVVIDEELQDRDDRIAHGHLDPTTLRALVRAALGAHEGRIVEVSVDADPRAPFDVTIVSSSGGTRTIELSREFQIVETDLDD